MPVWRYATRALSALCILGFHFLHEKRFHEVKEFFSPLDGTGDGSDYGPRFDVLRFHP